MTCTIQNRIKGFLAISASAVFLLSFSQTSFAKDEIGTVVAVKQSGWATRSNESVKQTLKVGDKLYNGDMLDIKHGNHIEIALDEKEQNILRVVGDSLVQLNNEGVTNVELTKGQVVAMLDNLGPSERFQVSTPTAISTVRGTHFKVLTNGLISEIFVYEGSVRTTGRFPNGKATKSFAVVEAGHKVAVDDFGMSPKEPVLMTETEFDGINEILAHLEKPKPLFDYSAAVTESSGTKQSTKDKDSEGANGLHEAYEDGKVVF